MDNCTLAFPDVFGATKGALILRYGRQGTRGQALQFQRLAHEMPTSDGLDTRGCLHLFNLVVESEHVLFPDFLDTLGRDFIHPDDFLGQGRLMPGRFSSKIVPKRVLNSVNCKTADPLSFELKAVGTVASVRALEDRSRSSHVGVQALG